MDAQLTDILKQRRRRKPDEGGESVTSNNTSSTPPQPPQPPPSPHIPQQRRESAGTGTDEARKERRRRGHGGGGHGGGGHRRGASGSSGVSGSGGGDDNRTVTSKDSTENRGERKSMTSSSGGRSHTKGSSSSSSRGDRPRRKRSTQESSSSRSTPRRRTSGSSLSGGGNGDRDRDRDRDRGNQSSDDTLGEESADDNDTSSDDDEDAASQPPPTTTTTATTKTTTTTNASITDDFGSAFGSSDVFGATTAADSAFESSSADPNSNANTNFEETFGSFPTSFGSFPTTTTTTTPTKNDDDDDDDNEKEEEEAYNPPSFALPPPPEPAKVYDKTPIDHPPVFTTEMKTHAPSLAIPRPLLRTSSLPAPVANPLTGNLILGRQTDNKDWCLVEWNPHTQSQVTSVPILSLELQRKVAQRYGVSASHVDSVLTLAVGVHQAHGYTRPRVACLMDLLVLDNREVLRVIAIWQWGGYGNSSGYLVQLQSILSPPSGSDFSYNTESLLVADSCVFVSGASAKGPCVFLCKPTVRETWSANFVGKEAARIASMAATTTTIVEDNASAKIRLPYLAIGLTDGSLSIWTYEAATKVSSKTTETLRRLLFPLCRLESTKLLKNASPTFWDPKDKDTLTSDAKELGYCTHLEWVSPRANAFSQLLMLAASFQGGLAFYHIALPKMQDKTSKKGHSYVPLKPPTATTLLSQTCSLKPFGIARWPTVHHRSFVSFCDVGPHLPPTVAVLVTGLNTNLDYARLALVTCQLPAHAGGSGLGNKGRDSLAPIQIWDSHEWTDSSSSSTLSHVPRSLIPSTYLPGILYVSDNHLQLATVLQGPRGGGLGSIPSGLTTSGTVHWSDTSSDKDGILHVYTTFHCERKKHDDLLEWSPPTRRHWLIQTMVGDCKDAIEEKKEEKEDEVITGGTSSSVVCELGGGQHGGELGKLVPYRILRNYQSKSTAVWFRCMTGEVGGETIAMIEPSNDDGKLSSIVQLMDGRELVFLPNREVDDDPTNQSPQALVVSKNGGSMALWQLKNNQWTQAIGMECRPILGVDEASEDYVECRQLTLCKFQEQVGFIAVAAKVNGKMCIIAGKMEAENGLVWCNILPNIEEDAVLWLEEGEQVSLVQPLPSEQAIRGGLALATSQRVMVLSPSLKILAQIKTRMPPSSISPLGSYTVAYCSHDDHKIRYLSGLPDSFGASGMIAAFPLPQYSYCPHWLLAVRPDRLIYTSFHTGTRLVERGQPSNVFLLPAAITRPALLLEPMVANAIATGGNDTAVQPFFRTVVEKFGRKVATMTHGEDEGIGNLGAGMTPRVFELLDHYKLKSAASWLLTGTVHFNRSANSRLLPAWMPISAKIKASIDADTNLHVIANGDQYFSEYVKSPDNNMSATLPRPSDPSAFLCKQFAMDALKQGQTLDALKMLDIAGTESADVMLLQLSLAMQMDPFTDVTPVLEALCQQDSQATKAAGSTAAASLAALALELKKNKTPQGDFSKRWMKPLAPSFQRGKRSGRLRPRLIGESAFHKVGKTEELKDRLFSTETTESKHVWNEGPNREKDNLLMLDHIQEWFGRRRPVILGKEGAKSAEDRGASTLADILAQPDDDSFGGDNNDDMEDGWADGVGEGHKDEDKLSAYYRFSEGEDEDSNWTEEGFADISKYEVKATLVGCNDSATLQESTSSVDEGESGKVKALFDIVFEQAGVGQAAALAIPASRGGSLDVGMMHGPDHLSRQKCSIEFWFWVPESIKREVILVRKTFGSSGDDLDNVCKASDKSSRLWDLALSSKGELEFRTVAGGKIKSKPKPPVDNDDDDYEEEDAGPKSTILFSRWNHVCITFKQESLTSSVVNVLVKGISECSGTLSFSPPDFEADDFSGASAQDQLLEKSHLVFGLDHPASFRLTELRVWALERDDDDIRTMMTEYLECAEMKRKFRVKIKKKGGDVGKFGALGTPKGVLAPKVGLAPPKGGLGLAPPKGSLAPPKGGLAPPVGSAKSTRKGLLAPPKASKTDEDEVKLAPPKEDIGFGFGDSDAMPSSGDTGFGSDGFGGFGESPTKDTAPASFDTGFGEAATFQDEAEPMEFQQNHEPENEHEMHEYDEEPEISPLWDSAIPLSEQVRSSAAAALIRGPPATRHFGGNRGGLPDYRELERFGVGAISICGSEKTIVWRDDQVPPGLTYPIGASGAIVSDQMDEDGSEFLCCFLAKDKRMVVFELSTRTVVVELQMTTKLNYWRFLPPEAGEDTLCFMLVTPVGGFHWMPLDESPRPRQVWKRGAELQGKKIVSYEEGGTNGLDGPDMLSKVGMLLVTNASTGGRLEAWLVPICGDSQAICASDDVLGSCLCRPPDVGYEAWMPLLLFVVEHENDLVVCVSAVTEAAETSVGLTEVMTDALIEQGPYQNMDYEPPTMAMGTWPEVLCCSLGSTIVIIVRRKGLVVAYELADTGLELIAQENVGHYVVDAVMRYSAVEGGAEIVLLMSDSENPRDGRVGTFCFRTAV